MATWFHLLVYLLFVINLPPFKLLNAESTVFRTASAKNIDLKSPDKKHKFLFKIKKEKRKKKYYN